MVELLTMVSSINFFLYMSDVLMVLMICFHLSVLFKMQSLQMQKNTEKYGQNASVSAERNLSLSCLSVCLSVPVEKENHVCPFTFVIQSTQVCLFFFYKK